MSVQIKFAGGVHADVRKMVAPLMGMVAASAGVVRSRVQRTGKGPKGRVFGRYARKHKRTGKTRYFWTPAGFPRSSAAVATDKQGRQLIRGWGAYQQGRTGGGYVAAGHAVNFTLTGGMWDGLTAKLQKSGRRVTINFQSGSIGKDSAPGKRGRGAKKIRNAQKAAFIAMRWAKRGEHILDMTAEEFHAFKSVFFQRSLLSVFKSASGRQDFEKAMKATGDPKMKRATKGAPNARSGQQRIKRR